MKIEQKIDKFQIFEQKFIFFLQGTRIDGAIFQRQLSRFIEYIKIHRKMIKLAAFGTFWPS